VGTGVGATVGCGVGRGVGRGVGEGLGAVMITFDGDTAVSVAVLAPAPEPLEAANE